MNDKHYVRLMILLHGLVHIKLSHNVSLLLLLQLLLVLVFSCV